jgi:hypothetical protein
MSGQLDLSPYRSRLNISRQSTTGLSFADLGQSAQPPLLIYFPSPLLPFSESVLGEKKEVEVSQLVSVSFGTIEFGLVSLVS